MTTVKLPHDPLDPLDLKGRVIRQVSKLLTELEADDQEQLLSFRERIAALTTIGRLLMVFRSLRGDENDGRAGSAVRKYAGAFAAERRGASLDDGGAPIDDDDEGWPEKPDKPGTAA